MTPLTSIEKVLVAVILFAILFFSIFHITESPPFNVDEGWAVQVATNISEKGVDGLQFAPGQIEHVSVLTSVGYPLLYPLAFWFRLFGAGIMEARLMMVLFMFGFAIASFWLLRRLYGNAIALSSLAILATFPPFYTFGKSVYGEVPMLFFLVVFLLCLNLALRNSKRKLFWLTLCGVSAGLCIVTKTMALAFIPVLLIALIVSFKKGLLSQRGIGIVLIGAIVPIIVWLIVNFQAGDSLASALGYYSNPSALTDKTATFWNNLKMFGSGLGPLFMLSLMSVWVIGVVIRVKAKTKIQIEEFIAIVFSTVIIVSFLFRYWDARYLFPVQALAILFAPYSLYCILLVLPVKLDIAKKATIFSCSTAFLSVLGLYQLSFSSFIADSYKSTYTADLSRYFSTVPDSTSVFFYNTTNVVPHFEGSNYYQRIAMFRKWVLGSEFAPIVTDAKVEMLVLGPPMLEEDTEVSLSKYEEVAKFREIRIFKRK